MVCSNMTGTEKQISLVIGKTKNPMCFKKYQLKQIIILIKWQTSDF